MLFVTGERLEQHTVEAFLKEGVIMKNFNHPHVLKLLGVCVNSQENPMVILPYMANGDLRSYVKDKKKVYYIYLFIQPYNFSVEKGNHRSRAY